jgi:hypothetical protein
LYFASLFISDVEAILVVHRDSQTTTKTIQEEGNTKSDNIATEDTKNELQDAKVCDRWGATNYKIPVTEFPKFEHSTDT